LTMQKMRDLSGGPSFRGGKHVNPNEEPHCGRAAGEGILFFGQKTCVEDSSEKGKRNPKRQTPKKTLEGRGKTARNVGESVREGDSKPCDNDLIRVRRV